jgi:hypothetical protein
MRILCLFLISLISSVALTYELTNEDIKNLASAKEEIRKITVDPILISELRLFNAKMPEKFKGLNNEVWAKLLVRDARVQELASNKIAQVLKARKKNYMSEMFVSTNNGEKAGFLQKTSKWSHQGIDKHEKPMSGEEWLGKVEYDESAGVNQVQLGIPIKDGLKVIGSLVVGVAIAKF